MFAGNQIQSYRSVIKTLLQKQQTFLVLHISIWGGRSFLWEVRWWWDWILGSCDSVSPPIGGMECGWYDSVCSTTNAKMCLKVLCSKK